MDLNEFAREVHANACAHGWWDEERDTAEIIALIHSEWSEALEEYRAGRPMVWHACGEQPNGNGEICNPQDEYDCTNYGRESECRYRGKKPEGIAVELIDGCIRILDWLGYKRHNIQNLGPEWYTNRTSCDDFPKFIALLHGVTSEAFAKPALRDFNDELTNIVDAVFGWIIGNGLDPEKIMLEKHEYNKTRPYRHGGKKC